MKTVNLWVKIENKRKKNNEKKNKSKIWKWDKIKCKSFKQNLKKKSYVLLACTQQSPHLLINNLSTIHSIIILSLTSQTCYSTIYVY